MPPGLGDQFCGWGTVLTGRLHLLKHPVEAAAVEKVERDSSEFGIGQKKRSGRMGRVKPRLKVGEDS